MKTCTFEAKHGIHLTACMQLDDLDFADDIALLSHTHQQIQFKTANVADAFALVGFNMHMGESKILKYNVKDINPTTFVGETLEDVISFTYLSNSIIDEQGRSDADVNATTGKVRRAFPQLRTYGT
ncbi:unnamed protein product [Schistosoma margrebowiei]|uniref:Uncharacterized protein n=1 Tax=Schistosoma margrebowiei TaxID=48269 RepID=A0A183M0D9_9TREM|nr:unnamed protein product [Schistosoma margrebowiei]